MWNTEIYDSSNGFVEKAKQKHMNQLMCLCEALKNVHLHLQTAHIAL